MADYFYRAFEERFYAPREVIKELRRQYLPFVAPLARGYPGAATFDVGCGRGEWLELMIELGFRPHGVDLDEGMLGACVALGLPASKGDGVDHVKSLGNETQAVITAFHVVEHITFQELRTVVSEALRALKPGGLLIMETPNPENLVVATKNSYLDPTHQRPIPPQLLEFLTEYSGFGRTKVLRLQESKELSNREGLSLWNVFSGASPDFAVIAQKATGGVEFAELNGLFARDYGLDTETLAMRYEQGLSEKLNEVLFRVDRSAQSEARANAIATELRQVEQQLGERLAEAHELTLRAERQQREVDRLTHHSAVQQHEVARLNRHIAGQQSEIDRLKQYIDWQQREWDTARAEAAARMVQVEAMSRSLSWRMTWPLRRLNAMRRRGLSYPRRVLGSVRRIAQAPAQERPTHVALWLMRRPALLAVVEAAASPFPSLRIGLKKHLALARAATEPARGAPLAADASGAVPKSECRDRPMTAHAETVLRDLRNGMNGR